MLTCVFHPIDAMRVVEEDEAERLRASGVWFDSPQEAQSYRSKVEDEIRNEELAEEPKPKKKGKSNER